MNMRALRLSAFELLRKPALYVEDAAACEGLLAVDMSRADSFASTLIMMSFMEAEV